MSSSFPFAPESKLFPGGATPPLLASRRGRATLPANLKKRRRKRKKPSDLKVAWEVASRDPKEREFRIEKAVEMFFGEALQEFESPTRKLHRPFQPAIA